MFFRLKVSLYHVAKLLSLNSFAAFITLSAVNVKPQFCSCFQKSHFRFIAEFQYFFFVIHCVLLITSWKCYGNCRSSGPPYMMFTSVWKPSWLTVCFIYWPMGGAVNSCNSSLSHHVAAALHLSNVKTTETYRKAKAEWKSVGLCIIYMNLPTAGY